MKDVITFIFWFAVGSSSVHFYNDMGAIWAAVFLGMIGMFQLSYRWRPFIVIHLLSLVAGYFFALEYGVMIGIGSAVGLIGLFFSPEP